MITLRYKMTQPTSTFDWGSFAAVFTICSTCLLGFFAYIKDRAKQRQEALAYKEKERAEFIERIAETAVNKTLDKVFADQNAKINTLFEYREDDRKHWDARFDGVMSKLGK